MTFISPIVGFMIQSDELHRCHAAPLKASGSMAVETMANIAPPAMPATIFMVTG